MVFHMPQKLIQLPLLKIAGTDIAFVDNFNFLGIIINKHINWTSHVDMLTAKLTKTIGRVGWGIAPIGGAKRAPLILANLELCGSIWRSNDSLQHTKDLSTDEDVLI